MSFEAKTPDCSDRVRCRWIQLPVEVGRDRGPVRVHVLRMKFEDFGVMSRGSAAPVLEISENRRCSMDSIWKHRLGSAQRYSEPKALQSWFEVRFPGGGTELLLPPVSQG